jgi:hypothetical protein
MDRQIQREGASKMKKQGENMMEGRGKSVRKRKRYWSSTKAIVIMSPSPSDKA